MSDRTYILFYPWWKHKMKYFVVFHGQYLFLDSCCFIVVSDLWWLCYLFPASANFSQLSWAGLAEPGRKDKEAETLNLFLIQSWWAVALLSLLGHCSMDRMGTDPKTTFTHFDQIQNGLSSETANLQGLSWYKLGSLYHHLYLPRNMKELCKIKT